MTGDVLLRAELTEPASLIALRHLSRRAAQLLGFTETETTRITTAVSELVRAAETRLPALARFVLRSGRGPGGVTWVDLVVELDVTGAVDVLADPEVRSALGRLMDAVTVEDDTVCIAKALPGPVDPVRRVRIHDVLLSETAPDARAQLQSVHGDLVRSLTELRDREAQLVALNDELDETNRGVVALYAELERNAAQIRRAQRAVFEELEEALRPPAPEVAGLEFAVRYRPAQANSPTGGDLYDWFPLPDATLQVTIVDVRGHGVESTRDALLVTHAVRTLILEGHPIGEVLGRVDTIVRSGRSPVVATALVAHLDPASGRAELAGAGHPAAVHVADGSACFVEAPGRGLGYPDAGSRGAGAASLAPGDTLLFYTDGFTEVRRDVVEGMETLRHAAAESARLPLAHLLDDVVERCVQGATLTDDALLLGVRRRA